MTAIPSSRPASRRPPLARPEIRACAAAAATAAAVVAAAAAWDPSGLLAPVGGRGLPLAGAGGVYRWAPLAIGFPILVTGTLAPLFLAVRHRRSTVTAWWVFTVTWIALVGAAALATAATGLAAATPLLGPHLAAGTALRFSIATSGFAAIKYVLIGPLAATAAALAYRFGPSAAADSPASTDAPALSEPEAAPGIAVGAEPPAAGFSTVTGTAAAVMLLVTAVAGVGFATRWWHGGPVGYAFTGMLPAPTATAGVLGYLTGTAVFLAVFAVTVRAAQRRVASRPAASTVAAAVWLAAIVAGLALGALDAAVAALPATSHLPDAGPDSWWIATTLLSVGTATGYGAAVGVIGAPLTALVWWRRGTRPAPKPSPRRRLAMTALATAVLAVPLAIGAPDPAGPPSQAPSAASGGMERLHLLPARDPDGLPVIGDVTGRQVILRGVNVNQLIDYHLRDPAIPAVQPPTDTDFAQIAAMGFNVVRLGMSWSRLEPQRGVFDQAYLAQISAAVAAAKAHGLYTVLDMHEDAWGNALARPTAQCGGGTTPTTGWDGAPAWATITDGTAHCQFMARDLAPAVATAFGNFYTDRDGIQTELVRTWAFVAKAFAGEPAVAGFDLLNEPGIGANPPISSGLLLGRYYDAAITAIRAAETAGGGHPHLVFFEPSVLWSGLAFDVTPPPGFTDDRQLVFAPHPYSESITMDQSVGLTIASIERNLTVSARAAASYGAALWTGEWGWFGDPATDGAKVQRFVTAQDRLGIGGAFWVWRQGCGSPETGPDALTSGNLMRVDCATGAAIPPPDGFAKPLTRAYPRAFPGRPDTLTSGQGGRDLHLAATAGDGANCAIDIWVPGDPQPRLATTGVADPLARKVPGGWQITGCARGGYTVTVTA